MEILCMASTVQQAGQPDYLAEVWTDSVTDTFLLLSILVARCTGSKASQNIFHIFLSWLRGALVPRQDKKS
eukprot:745209-Pelagomonas_calceolata.AAC.1